ncbi:MAG: hypothetical protein DRI95_14970 [Bacteroidetes bacterium]|nr:MAG: hypothetical protein DRI95_14970 [Bacteroidota bacterium]
MKERQFLHVRVNRKDGNDFSNELKLNEAHLIKALLKQEQTDNLVITLESWTPEKFNLIFGS